MKRDEDQSPELSMSLEHYQASRKKKFSQYYFKELLLQFAMYKDNLVIVH